MSRYQIIIGRFEHVNIADVLQTVPAKIDTGAYRSSVHVDSVEEVKLKNGETKLKFRLLGHASSPKTRVLSSKKFRKRIVVSSSGHKQIRYEVNLKLKLAGKIFVTPFTLSDRSKTIFPVLVGRKALNGRFLVDSSKSSISRLELKQRISEREIEEEDLEGINI
ncbi:MAG TPA: RimK/LysX family protein [Candidatus Saccharibacteria bacterium]|jgi:hypothetical protein|nr:RimK/LysX family protein [Candidatus Saccharibacteria bacterium]